jgi:hypothetical protein
MSTYSEDFNNKMKEILKELKLFFKSEYDNEGLRIILSKLGIKLELYLKNVVFPSKSGNDNFYSFINELLRCGLVQSELDILHELRKNYNKAKHDSNYEFNLLNLIDLAKRLEPVIDKLTSKNLGLSSNHLHPHENRIYLILGWDHYIGGNTEIHLQFPEDVENDFMLELDLIYIKLDLWDHMLKLLSHAGVLKKANEYYSPEIMEKIIHSDTDILTPYVWEGQYRTLLRILIQHELQLDLLPSLRRQDNIRSMRIAVLCAAIDLSPHMIGCGVNELSTAIKNSAINVYGVPSDLNQLQFLCDSISRMIFKLDTEHWSKLAGPKWIRQETIADNPNSIIIHEFFNGIYINKDFQIVYSYL